MVLPQRLQVLGRSDFPFDRVCMFALFLTASRMGGCYASGIVPAQSSASGSSCVPPNGPALDIQGPLAAENKYPQLVLPVVLVRPASRSILCHALRWMQGRFPSLEQATSLLVRHEHLPSSMTSLDSLQAKGRFPRSPVTITARPGSLLFHLRIPRLPGDVRRGPGGRSICSGSASPRISSGI
jgi:hypothetical protein